MPIDLGVISGKAFLERCIDTLNPFNIEESQETYSAAWQVMKSVVIDLPLFTNTIGKFCAATAVLTGATIVVVVLAKRHFNKALTSAEQTDQIRHYNLANRLATLSCVGLGLALTSLFFTYCYASTLLPETAHRVL